VLHSLKTANRTLQTICCVLFALLCVASAAFAEPLLTVELGAPRREEAPRKIETPYGIAVYASDKSNSFVRVREETCAHHVYRMHVPVRITCHAAAVPRMATLCYAFAYASRQDDLRPALRALTNLLEASLQVTDIPLQAGVTEWTLTSRWMVQLDPRLWASSDGYLEETRDGQTRQRRRAPRGTATARSLSSFFLPYRLAMWVPEQGLDGAWPESEFQHLVIRNVQGNEAVAGLAVYVFTEAAHLSGGGTTDNRGLERLVQQFLPQAANPHRQTPVFTNTWEARGWAGAVARTTDPNLRAALLARITREQPDDRDAADLLLQSVAQQDDASRAFRVYQQHAQQFGDLREHWFMQYYQAVSNPAARRAALVVYRHAHPESAWALEKMVEEMIADEQWQLAQRLVAAWLTREPSNATVYVRAARIAAAEDRADDARRYLTMALALVLPRDAAVTGMYLRGSAAYREYLLGMNALRAGEHDRAQAHLRQAVARAATYYPATLAQARYYLTNTVASAARRELNLVLRTVPDHPAALNMLAQLQTRRRTSSMPVAERLRAVLQPRIDAAMARQDWTNVATMTRVLLEAAPEHTPTRVAYAQALLRVQQYDDASAALRAIAQREQGSAPVRAAWAELCRAMDEDQGVVVVANHPLDWRQRQIELWQSVHAAAPRDVRALLELALLYRRQGKWDDYCTTLCALYKAVPSPAMALWLGDTCLQKAVGQPHATMPQQPGRTYLQEARACYQKTGVSRDVESRGRIDFGMPAAYVGYARSAELNAGAQDDPLAFIRAGTRRFPAAPEPRAALIANALSHHLLAPLLWQPYTNQLVALFGMRADVAAALVALHKEIGPPKAYADALARQAAILVRSYMAVFPEGMARQEYRRPAQVYVLDHDARTTFAARRLAFLTPAEAYDWYAIRSRYTAADLLNGNTRWWQRRCAIERGLAWLNDAGRCMGSTTNETYAGEVLGRLYQPLLGELQLNDTMKPSAAYVTELFTCFNRTRERAARARRHMTLRAQTGQQFELETLPALVTCEQALPTEARPWFAPPDLLFATLWRSDSLRATPWWNGAHWRLVPQRLVQVPGGDWSFSSASGRIRTPGLVTGVVAQGLLTFAQQAAGSPAETNHAAVTLLQGTDARVPMLPGMFAGAVTGAIWQLDLRARQFNPEQPPRLLLALTPAPLTEDVRDAGDEALVLAWQWNSLTNVILRVYARAVALEQGMPPGECGVPLGELQAPDASDFFWRIDRTAISVWCTSTPQRISAAHGLSAYAWPRGMHLATQLIISPTAYSVQARGMVCGSE
jgi:predicted Zn-dependent protease